MIRLDDILRDRKVFYVPSDDPNLTYSEAHIKLLENPGYEMICFSDYKKILLYNIAVLRIDEAGKYYYDMDLEPYYDIIGGFTIYAPGLDVNMSLLIGPDEYKFDEFEEIAMISAIYSHIRIRFTFNTVPKNNKEIGIQTIRYLCNGETRNALVRNKVVAKYSTYHNGVCLKN